MDIIDELPFGADPSTYYDSETDLKTDMDADSCLQKISNWEKYRQFWLDYYDKKIEEVKHKCDNNIEYNRRRLRDFFSNVPHRSTKTQEVYDLPNGKISVSFSKPSLIPDRKSILERLKRNGETDLIKVKTTEDIDWSRYKERLFISEDGSTVFDNETGKKVEDVSIEYSEPEFKVTLKKAKEENEDE